MRIPKYHFGHFPPTTNPPLDPLDALDAIQLKRADQRLLNNIFDYVIVGAGSAGCVLANRLSEDGKYSVCILEAGGSDRSIYIQMPSAVAVPMVTPKFIWPYVSEPEPHLAGRRIYSPRGRVLGGCSSINGMVYMRGHPLDFDEWLESGASGWGYENVLPYFRRAESKAEGGDAWRGDSGPLKTQYGQLKNPLYSALIAAGKQAGYPESVDLNGFQQEGFGRFDMNGLAPIKPDTDTPLNCCLS